MTDAQIKMAEIEEAITAQENRNRMLRDDMQGIGLRPYSQKEMENDLAEAWSKMEDWKRELQSVLEIELHASDFTFWEQQRPDAPIEAIDESTYLSQLAFAFVEQHIVEDIWNPPYFGNLQFYYDHVAAQKELTEWLHFSCA